MEVKDCNGNILKEGDTVVVMKTLKVKGSSLEVKKGLVIKNIRLTDDPEEIDCKAAGTKLVLKTCYLKKG